MDKVRCGVIGYGNMGTSHSKWINNGIIPGMTLSAVCDINPERIEVAKGNLDKSVEYFDDYRKMIDSGKVDAVIIAVPHYHHPEMAIYTLEHGVHAMVDIKLKEIMESGKLGNIRRVTWMITSWWRTQKYYDSSSWRATWGGEGGGVLMNQAPHQLDLLQWLTGMPSMIRAYLKYGSHRKIDVEDDVTAYFEYPNGATGCLITCTHDAMGTDRFEILGDNGKIIVEDSSKVTVKMLNKSEHELSETLDFRQMLALIHGQTGEKLYTEETFSIPENWDQQHIDVLKNFTDAILTGKALVAPGAEGIKAVEIADAMYLSSWLGKEIELPIDDDLFLSELEKKVEEERKRG